MTNNAVVPRQVNITLTFAPAEPTNTQTPNNTPVARNVLNKDRFDRDAGHRPTDTEEHLEKAKKSTVKHTYLTLLWLLGLGAVITVGYLYLLAFNYNKLNWVTTKTNGMMALRGLIFVLSCFALSGFLILLVRWQHKKLGWVINAMNYFASSHWINLFLVKVGLREVFIWFFLLMLLDVGYLSGLGLLDILASSPTKYILATLATFIVTRQMDQHWVDYKYFWYAFLLGCTLAVIVQTVFGWDIFHIHQSFDSGLRMK